MAADKPLSWSVTITGDASGGYELMLRFSGKTHRFTVAGPPDIGELAPLAGQDIRGPETIELLASAATIENLREIGRKLYRYLLFDPAKQDDFGEDLQTLLDVARDEKRTLAFRLDLRGARDLAAVPWEALYSDSEKSFLATRELFGLTRVCIEQDLPPPDPVIPPLKVLVLVADPTGKLNTELEVERLRKVFDAGGDDRIAIEARYLTGVTRVSFAETVFEWMPHVVHYIGHGEFTEIGSLWLHEVDREAGIDRLNAEELRNVFDDKPPWMVVLNSCEGAVMGTGAGFGGLAQELLETGVPFVIAMQSRISDRAAITFANGFYTALARREPVSHAVAGARKLMRVALGEKSAEMITPALYAASMLDRIQFIEPPPAKPFATSPGSPKWVKWGSLAAAVVVALGIGTWAGIESTFSEVEVAIGERDSPPTSGSRDGPVRAEPGDDYYYADDYAFGFEYYDDYGYGFPDASVGPDDREFEAELWRRLRVAQALTEAGWSFGALAGSTDLLAAPEGSLPAVDPDCPLRTATVAYERPAMLPAAEVVGQLDRFVTALARCERPTLWVDGTEAVDGSGAAAAALAIRRTHQVALVLARELNADAIVEVAGWAEPGRPSAIPSSAPTKVAVYSLPLPYYPIEAPVPFADDAALDPVRTWGWLAAAAPSLVVAPRAWNIPEPDSVELQRVRPALDEGVNEYLADYAVDDQARAPRILSLRGVGESAGPEEGTREAFVEVRFFAPGVEPIVWREGVGVFEADADERLARLVAVAAAFAEQAERVGDEEMTPRILLEGHSLRGPDDTARRLDSLQAVGEVAARLTADGIDAGRIVGVACGARREREIPSDADRAVVVSFLPFLLSGPERACGWNEDFWAVGEPVSADE